MNPQCPGILSESLPFLSQEPQLLQFHRHLFLHNSNNLLFFLLPLLPTLARRCRGPPPAITVPPGPPPPPGLLPGGFWIHAQRPGPLLSVRPRGHAPGRGSAAPRSGAAAGGQAPSAGAPALLPARGAIPACLVRVPVAGGVRTRAQRPLQRRRRCRAPCRDLPAASRS